MKKLAIFNISILFLLVLMQPIFAQEELKRTISKKYVASADTRLELTNLHGNMDINTWDKNEITVDVTIIARGRKAQEFMDKITIDHEQIGNEISFETNIEGIHITGRNNFEIHYQVNMPPKNTLEVANKYGNVFLDDFQGKLEMEVRYGKLRANKLSGDTEKDIQVAYGGLDIEELEHGELEISYSNGEIGKAGKINLENKYGAMKFGTVKELELEIKYGGLNIDDEAETITGEMAYSKFSVGKLLKTIALDVRYAGGFDIKQVAQGFKEINLEGSYSTFNIEFANNADFDFHITTHYGGFNNSISEQRTDLQKDIKEGQASEYEGKVGKGGGIVRIDTRYGSVRFR